jgi:hypothetical protein
VRGELALVVGQDQARPPQAGTGVWRHLRSCPACRSDYAGYLAARRALAAVAAAPGPGAPFFVRLERDTLQAIGGFPPPRRRVRRRPLLLAVACLLAAILPWWLSGRADPRQPGTRLLQQPARTEAPGRVVTPAAWITPLGLTPSRQGLRGLQQLSRDPFLPAPPTR